MQRRSVYYLNVALAATIAAYPLLLGLLVRFASDYLSPSNNGQVYWYWLVRAAKSSPTWAALLCLGLPLGLVIGRLRQVSAGVLSRAAILGTLLIFLAALLGLGAMFSGADNFYNSVYFQGYTYRLSEPVWSPSNSNRRYFSVWQCDATGARCTIHERQVNRTPGLPLNTFPAQLLADTSANRLYLLFDDERVLIETP